jgi:hypothetical protein
MDTISNISDDNDDQEVIIGNYENFLDNKYSSNILNSIYSHEKIQTTNNVEMAILHNNLNELSNIPKQDIKNGLYLAIKLNMRCIKTIYYLLLRLQIYELKYRNKCKCCVDTSFEIFNKEFENNNVLDHIPTDYKIIFLIKKLTGIIDLLPCECSFDKKITEFYKVDFLNYKEYNQICDKILYNLIQSLFENNNIPMKITELKLIQINRCIHEDIRYNNLIFCQHKKYDKNNKIVREIIKETIQNIYNTYNFLQTNKQITNRLYTEQSFKIFKTVNINYFEYFKKIYIKQFYAIDIHQKIDNETIITYLLKMPIDTNALNQIFLSLIEEFRKKNDFQKILADIINQTITYNKYDICIYLCNYVDTINNFVIDKILLSNISTYSKIIFIKTIQNLNNNILDKLIENKDGDLIISNELKLNCSNPIDLLNKCIYFNKINIFEYILTHYKDKIKTPYIYYFNNIKSDYESYLFLNIINKFDYNIDIKINCLMDKVLEYENGYNLLYYCISKNYIYSAITLLKNGINVNEMYDNKTLFIYSIETNNYEISMKILQQDTRLSNKLYNTEYPISILLKQPIIHEIKYVKLVKELLLTNQYKNIGFLLLNLNISKLNKNILFNNVELNPLEKQNNIPLILSSLLMDEYEITYNLLQNLITNNKLKKNISLSGTIYEYEINENINFIPIILKQLKEKEINKNLLNKNEIEEKDIHTLFYIIIYVSIMLIQELCSYKMIKNNSLNNIYNFEFTDNDTNEFIEIKNNIWANTQLIIETEMDEEITEDNIYFSKSNI